MSVRPLAVVLVIQLVLAAGLLAWLASGDDLPFISDEPTPTADSRPPAPPAPAAQTAADGDPPKARAKRFDARRAMALVRLQVGYGPRPAGSDALRALAPKLRDRLPRARLENIPGHPGLRNVTGRIPGRRPAILVAAHYDTEATVPDHVGANDGAAGTAAVLELSRALAKARRSGDREIRFALFDGEEEPAGTEGQNFYDVALRGSKAYVARHGKRIQRLILLDYIANKGLALPREMSSDTTMWSALRRSARRVGVLPAFPAQDFPGSVIDDHTPFLEAGIPAIDLIDFTYEHADTAQDTPDKLSQRSIDAVGETVFDLVRRYARR